MSEKKIGRPKKMDDAKPITFKLPAELYSSLKDYASSCGQDVSEILREYVTGLVAANKTKIANFRRQKNKGVKATFATSSKPARASKKEKVAAFDDKFVGDEWQRVRALFDDIQTFNFGTDINCFMYALGRTFVDLIDICDRDEKKGFSHSGYRFEDADGCRDDGHEAMRSFALTIMNFAGVSTDDWYAATTHDLNSLKFTRRGLRAAINWILSNDGRTKWQIDYYLQKNISNFTAESFLISVPVDESITSDGGDDLKVGDSNAENS